MKNKIVLLLICTIVLPFYAVAQVQLYDDMCDPLQAVFCDYVRNESSQNFLSAPDGQYTGTLIDGKIYGWGFILAADGTRSFGQFRNGKNIFGLSINDKVAKVGSEKHYVLYDLATGEIARLYTKEGDMNLEYPLVSSEKEGVSPYSFKKERYANGDVYIGEFYKGKRHGYGVYYWKNGDIWYGKYEGGYRNGYGMLINADHRIFYGKWLGDSRVDE
ncbi:MAG: hypothetical protein IKJ61_00275 [Bacteroidaceae bacterium]|nr:hypothetical protein [Bacteroidaceae bacterium]